MTFTDEDLEALKRLSIESDTIYGFNVRALLARLEAAEKKCSVADLHMVIESSYPSSGYCNGCQHDLPHKAGCPWNEADQAWREAAGR